MATSQLTSLLLGVVIGGAVSFAVSMATEYLKERRQRARHWEDLRLKAYVDFARGAKEGMWYLFRVAAHLGNDPNPEPMTMDDAKVFLAAAYDKRDQAFESLTLVGTRELVDRCREWTTEISTMRLMVDEGRHDPDKWSSLVSSARIARDRFHDAARSDLRIPR